MRIDRLDLLAYGPFTGKSLDFTDGSLGLHLVYGDNEAGKSSSLRALIAWLFGIPVRTNDNFIHANPQLRIGGQLRLLDGTTLEFTRKKGNKATLLHYRSGEPLDDNAIEPFLPASIDENIFTKFWGIDHERLIAGGRELLEQSGDLGQALFSAAVGTDNLREVLADMQKRAGEIFKPRASTALLNRAVADYKDARKRVKEATLPVAEWKGLLKNLSETDAAIERIEKEIEAKSRTKSRLERLGRVTGVLAQRRAVLEKIAALGPVDLLPEDFEEKRKNGSASLRDSRVNNERLQVKLQRLREESGSLNVRDDLLENEETILTLYRELGAVEKTMADRPQQDGKRRELRNEARRLLKSVRPDVGLDQADTLRPLVGNRKWVTGLAQKYDRLVQNKAQARKSLRDIEDERRARRSELDGSPPSSLDVKKLKAVVSAARKAGNLEQRLAGAAKQALAEHRACRDELVRLGRFSGPVDSLLRLSLPVSETLDRFERESDDLLEELRNAARKKGEVDGEKMQSEQALKDLLLQLEVPTLADLDLSREDRENHWRLIKRRCVEKAGTDEGLTVSYEHKVKHADYLADRLRMDADTVVRRAELESRIEALGARQEELAETMQRLSGRQNSFQTRWKAVWEPLKVEAGTPREMKQWLLRVEKLVEKVQTAQRLSRDEENLAAECFRLKQSVIEQVSVFDPSVQTGGASLENLISLCEQRIEDEEAARENRRRIEHSLSESEIRRKRKFDELQAIETELSGWAQEWGKAVRDLGLGPDVHPEQATEMLDNLLNFFDRFDRAEELRRRIYGMDQVKEKFDGRVIELAGSIGCRREGAEPSAIAAQLHRELNLAREARASLTKLETQAREISEELEGCNAAALEAGEQLAGLRKQAGVATDEELVAAGERSRTRRGLDRNLDQLEQELSRNGDGLSIEELEREAAESEVDAIEGQLDTLLGELKALYAERDRLRDSRLTLQNGINEKDGSARAADASEEAEEFLAAMVSNAEQYLRLQAAALILEGRIESYRRANQAPVLARAGGLFSRLTLGSYAGLRDELDGSGRPLLLGLRPDNMEVAIAGMSEGSRDQLYLALRLATLEQHLEKGEPMPFVVDDILMGFDDNRTRVCLEVLAELASKTQVLLFTHHRRVIELAGSINADAGVFIHEL
jgi:uncharacterized protein YhaN